MDYRKYFERIGLSPDLDIAHNEAFLSKLQYHHVISVPYENLDILNGIPISLDINDIYNKIVVRHRGGFCFELNALFRGLLEELGFSVKSYFARYWRGEKDIPLRRHHVLTVDTADGLFVCDVGIGQVAPRYPLSLEAGKIQIQGNESYRFEYEGLYGWVLYELRHGSWEKYFSFTEDEALQNDFIQASFYCEKHPDSPFNKDIIVALKTPDGRKSLSGRCYKEFLGSELVAAVENADDEVLEDILKRHFGII